MPPRDPLLPVSRAQLTDAQNASLGKRARNRTENVIFAGEDKHRPWILVGDKTNKGGVVFTGAPDSTVRGRGMARVGDRATCRCSLCKGRGYTVIVSGSGTFTTGGLAVARDGDLTDCGAVLIATDGALVDQARGIAASPVDPAAHTHDQGFLIRDAVTQEPVAGRLYRLTFSAGVLEGRTNDQGYTDRPSASACEPVRIELFAEGL